MDKAVKRERYHRLSRNGLWLLADAMMETLRIKWRSESVAKQRTSTSIQDKEIAARAWDSVYAQLSPLCDKLEKLSEKPEPKKFEFIGFAGDPEELVDSDYDQDDPVQQNADAYLWLQEEFRRVVIDTEEGTEVVFSKATRKPPTILAVQLCEEYARDKPGSTGRKKMFGDIQKAIGKLPKKKDDGGGSSEVGYAGDL